MAHTVSDICIVFFGAPDQTHTTGTMSVTKHLAMLTDFCLPVAAGLKLAFRSGKFCHLKLKHLVDKISASLKENSLYLKPYKII